MFYKVVLDGMVIDVIDGKTYVKYQERNNLILLSKERDAFGILSSDSSTIWHEEGLQDPPAGRNFSTVQTIEISEEEAKELRAQLAEGEPVENPEQPDPGEEPEPEQPQETVMTALEMRNKITELTAMVNELARRNDMHEECLLELSEVVYA